jgi:hypothetical protein
MQVTDLEGNVSKLNTSPKNKKKPSKLFLKVVDLIRSKYSLIRICQELRVRIRPGKMLYLDMYLPDFNLAIEVNGRQHYEFVPHYHKYRHQYARNRLNDDLKREWCEINNIKLIELKYSDSIEEWDEQINRATGRVGEAS